MRVCRPLSTALWTAWARASPHVFHGVWISTPEGSNFPLLAPIFLAVRPPCRPFPVRTSVLSCLHRIVFPCCPQRLSTALRGRPPTVSLAPDGRVRKRHQQRADTEFQLAASEPGGRRVRPRRDDAVVARDRGGQRYYLRRRLPP